MIVTCDVCALVYDDVYRWTYCPHETFQMRTKIFRKDGTMVICTTVEQLQRELLR